MSALVQRRPDGRFAKLPAPMFSIAGPLRSQPASRIEMRAMERVQFETFKRALRLFVIAGNERVTT